MTALLLTVLVASLVGSLHCAGMCGAFVAFAIGAGEPAVKASRGVLMAAYQGGRLVTYVMLGMAAGILGAGLDLGGRWVGMQRTAAVAAGALMVGFGVQMLLRQVGVKAQGLRFPGLTKLVAAGNRRALRWPPIVRAGVTGLLTTLLPCGWLYAFAITAAGTGSAWPGAAVMAMFWVGTLPVLTFLGVAVRTLAAPWAARLPAVTASAIVAVGLYTIVARAQIVLPAVQPHRTAQPAELVKQIEAVDQSKLPCCTQKAEDKP